MEAINDILDTVEDYKAAGYSLKTESEFMDEFRSDMLAELGKAENPIINEIRTDASAGFRRP